MPDPLPPEATPIAPHAAVLVTPSMPLYEKAMIGFAFVMMLGMCGVMGVILQQIYSLEHPAPPVAPSKPTDAAFVGYGKILKPKIVPAFAAGYEAAADALDSGKSLSASLAAVDTTRQAALSPVAAPALSAILPASTADGKETPAQRSALSAAFRGLAEGLK